MSYPKPRPATTLALMIQAFIPTALFDVAMGRMFR